MNGSPRMRTRKKVAEDAKEAIGKPTMNGHANGSIHSRRPDSETEPTENIFLFYPNIIGQTRALPMQSPRPTDARMARLFSHHSCNRIPLLHAPPPSNLLSPLQHLLPPGRPRRRSSAAFPAIDAIRRRARYGDGSMHNRLLARLPGLGMATLGAAVSGPDKLRPGEPLHTHVCNADDGGEWAESQKGRFLQE